MTGRVKILDTETLSKRWAELRRYVIDYTRRDGRHDRLVREVHDHGSAAAVLPHDPARGTVLLVRQFRLPVYLAGQDGHILEICAGLLDGEPPEACARREAEEELGYRISNLRLVADCFSTPGAVTEKMTLFLADYAQDGRVSEGGGLAQEGEDIEVVEMPLTEALRLMESRTLCDAKTVMALLFLERELRARPAPRR